MSAYKGFRKYMHIERFGEEEVRDIEFGNLVIMPKIDGSNGSVWIDDDGIIKAGSRNRELSSENTNQGFYDYVMNNENIKSYLEEHPEHRLFGEWLIPHSFRHYRDDAWRKFYIFDVLLELGDGDCEYLPYEIYQPLLEEHGLDYIVPICTMKNGNYESFIKLLDKNYFLLKEGIDTPGEGIVIKNYDFKNKYGRTVWAKIVRQEFKEVHAKAMGASEMSAKKMVEEDIVDQYCTEAFIEKEFKKMLNSKDGGWRSQYIPELLGRVFSELIKEESWNIIKSFKYPTINYKTLNTLVIQRIKQVKSDLFG